MVPQIDPHWESEIRFGLGHTVDGIHYLITEPRPFSTQYSSHKFGGKAALVYEFVVSVHEQRLVWINGPFPAGTQDRTVFRRKLKQAIEAKQQQRSGFFRVIADDGYFAKDLTGLLSFRNELDPHDLAYFKDRALSRHESFNRLTKNYDCMEEAFHHDKGENPDQEHPRHEACLVAICVTTNYELELGTMTLFEV